MGNKRKKSNSSPENKEDPKRAAIRQTESLTDKKKKKKNCKLNMQNIQNATTPGSQHQYQNNNVSYNAAVPNNNASPVQTFTYAQLGTPPYYQTQYQGPSTPLPLNPVQMQMPINTVSADQFQHMMARFDKIEVKLNQLDTINSSVGKITGRLDKMESRIKSVETKIVDIEQSKNFDSESIGQLEQKQKEIDSMLQKMKSIEKEHNKASTELKSEIVDLKSRSMRDNLIFYGIEEEQGEKDEDCVRKVLELIEDKLEIVGAKDTVKLHRAHRMGKYNNTKTRPIVAKFAYYPEREEVRSKARKLVRPLGISQQFPREVMDERKRLIPIMIKARQDKKDAYIAVDKLFINGHQYRETGTGSSA